MSEYTITLEGTHGEDPQLRHNLDRELRTFVDRLRTIGAPVSVQRVEAGEDAGPAGDLPTEVRPQEPTHAAAAPQASTLTVDFASATAAEEADAADLTNADFEGVEPSAESGYGVDDVRAIVEARDA